MIVELRDELNRPVVVDLDAQTWTVDGQTADATEEQLALALSLAPSAAPAVPATLDLRVSLYLESLRAAVSDAQITQAELVALATEGLEIFELKSATGGLTPTEAILFRVNQALLLLSQQGAAVVANIAATVSALDDRCNRNGLTP